MNRMPPSVKVGAHVYSVRVKPAAQMTRTDGRADTGYCRFDQLEILVKRGQRRSKAQEALLHEVEHACCYPDLIGKRMTDEQFIEHTAPALLQVLKDNPELVAYLTKEK